MYYVILLLTWLVVFVILTKPSFEIVKTGRVDMTMELLKGD